MFAICDAQAAFEYPDADVRCITLGSPRVGNGHFVRAVKYLAGCSYRLVHGWDPVPTVPPPGAFLCRATAAAVGQRCLQFPLAVLPCLWHVLCT
jgi:Lipase (class 3)